MCPLFCACVRLELLLFNQDRQNLLTIFVSHESWPNFLLSYFCFQFQSHQKLANFATFTTQFCKQFQNDNSVTNMALKLKQKRLSGQCHLNFRISCPIVSHIWYKKYLCNLSRSSPNLVSYHEKNSTISFQLGKL